MKFFKLLILVLTFTFLSCHAQESKINGVSFVAASNPIDKSHVDPIVKISANYAAIMPFAFIRSLNHSEVVFNTDRQWFGETNTGVKQYVEQLRKQNIKIMLKPQLWVWRGEYTGFIEMTTESDWKMLESTYSQFIMNYAKLAQDLNAELFCIGTELEKFVAARPEFWNTLIKQIKSVYKGKVTYAANWDEFKRTPFWNELDYIGIDAYFPISEEKTPSLESCLMGWEAHRKVIMETSKAMNKKVLFTEFGYRSVDYAGKEPWKSDRSMTNVNLEAQSVLTQSLFDTFWTEDWFAGGFLWKWFHNYKDSGGLNNSQFTPQNKPVEAIIHHQFKNEN